MHLVYEDTKEEILAIERRAKHQPPHISIRFATIAASIGGQLYFDKKQAVWYT